MCSPGLWAAPAASYCPSRDGRTPKTKHDETSQTMGWETLYVNIRQTSSAKTIATTTTRLLPLRPLASELVRYPLEHLVVLLLERLHLLLPQLPRLQLRVVLLTLHLELGPLHLQLRVAYVNGSKVVKFCPTLINNILCWPKKRGYRLRESLF